MVFATFEFSRQPLITDMSGPAGLQSRWQDRWLAPIGRNFKDLFITYTNFIGLAFRCKLVHEQFLVASMQ